MESDYKGKTKNFQEKFYCPLQEVPSSEDITYIPPPYETSGTLKQLLSMWVRGNWGIPLLGSHLVEALEHSGGSRWLGRGCLGATRRGGLD